MKMTPLVLAIAAGTLLLGACGSDSTTSGTPAEPTTSAATTAPAATQAPTTAGSAGNPVNEGPVTFTSKSLTITDAVLSSCLIGDGTQPLFTASSPTHTIQAYPSGGTSVDIVISGADEWEGRGDASLRGDVLTITGAGSPQGAGTATEDFTLEARVLAC